MLCATTTPCGTCTRTNNSTFLVTSKVDEAASCRCRKKSHHLSLQRPRILLLSSFVLVFMVVALVPTIFLSSSSSSSSSSFGLLVSAATSVNHRRHDKPPIMIPEHDTSAETFYKNIEYRETPDSEQKDSTEKNTAGRKLQTTMLVLLQNLDPKWTVVWLTFVVGFVVTRILLYVYDTRSSSLSIRYGMPVMSNGKGGFVTLPFIGHALNFLKYRPWDLMMEWHQRYGPIVCFPLLGEYMFTIGSPSLIKIVLQSRIEAVKKDVYNIYKPFLVILGTGIVTSENESWMKQRLKMSQLLRFDVLELIPQQTLVAVQRLMKKMDHAAAAATSTDKDGDDVDTTNHEIAMGSSLRHLTLQVISGTFLSLSADESDSTFAEMYLPIVDESNIRVWHPYRSYCIFLPSFWKHLYNVYRLNTYVSHIIHQRWTLRRQEDNDNDHDEKQQQSQQTIRQQDILDRMLMVVEKEYIKAQKQKNAVDTMTLPAQLPEPIVRQLRDEMKTFMLAGHETSAAMMTWAIYECMGNATLRDRIADEARSVFHKHMPDVVKASSDDLPSANELANLELAEATLKESLRKYSVVPTVARRTIDDLHMADDEDEKGGGSGKKYFIPKGSPILINIQAVHHDERYWPDPVKFDPDRFLGKQAIEPFTFLPFIAGPRNCLGQHLALLESKMVIGMLLQRYHFSLPKGRTVQVNELGGLNAKHDPRHRYMVPVIPQEELMVRVTRK